ncbi:hypothetical protein KALB_6999 [Kutzneria albida DSM 43870]|uniref:Uncharacterized protein n=1 Tax=Kutzneria albida DSM 43870 TaxID=1449976 RepID=W5WID8_9PSEU|nr:hypothetical protein KALB_6999 [Kutzneria albida DSM 43870]
MFSHLDKSLHDHLSDLVRLAEGADERTAVGLARSELPRMVTALKALLDEHQPDENGRCPTCRSRRFSRRLPSPCRAYLAAHLCLTITREEQSAPQQDGATPRRRNHLRSAG